jgi:hypothetical protein
MQNRPNLGDWALSIAVNAAIFGAFFWYYANALARHGLI